MVLYFFDMLFFKRHSVEDVRNFLAALKFSRADFSCGQTSTLLDASTPLLFFYSADSWRWSAFW